MDLPLLVTKLHVPPLRPDLVSRPRLTGRLSEALRRDHRLILVSAPAGYGKTTLVRAWLQCVASQARVAWLSLDEADSEPTRFLSYLVAALQKVDDGIGADVQAALQSPQAPHLEPLVVDLVNDLAVALAGRDSLGAAEPPVYLGRRIVLVLDDYHTITHPEIHTVVGFLLDHLPVGLHVVISTRADPPLALPRLRGRGQITEVQQRDLGFSAEESADFLRQAASLELDRGAIESLQERAEGWIAGLQMFALLVQGRGAESAVDVIESFSGQHHFVLDYLTDEVLAHQPDRTRDFLLQTSILERMCGSLCDAVLAEGRPGSALPEASAGPLVAAGDGSGASQSVLEHLASANAFVVPLDDKREWYRLHHLFAELLRARLGASFPGQAPTLHRRAAEWHVRSGMTAGAVRHAMAIPDHELAADVIGRAADTIATWSSVSTAVFLGWIRALPAGTVRARPWLRLYQSRALALAGNLASAESALSELEVDLREQRVAGRDCGELLQRAAADRVSYALLRGDVVEPIRYAEGALATTPEDDAAGRLRPLAILGIAHLRVGNVAAAEHACMQAIGAAEALGAAPIVATMTCGLAEIQIAAGQLRAAYRTCERTRELVPAGSPGSAAAGPALIARARIHYERNQLEAAERSVTEGLGLVTRTGSLDSRVSGHLLLARILHATGDEAGSQLALDRAAGVAQASGIDRLVGTVSAYQARLWLSRGEVGKAAQWADTHRIAPSAAYAREVAYSREIEELTFVRVMLATGGAEEAGRLLDEMVSSAHAGGRTGSLVEILILQALCQDALAGRATDPRVAAANSLGSLSKALTLAEPEGYVRTFIDEGEAIRPLLVRAARRGVVPAYVRELLGALDRVGEGRPAQPSAFQPLIEPLSPREMDVLFLLAEALTNREIARRLFISLPTVKSHTSSIYGKLGVHRRREAVARARALGILPASA